MDTEEKDRLTMRAAALILLQAELYCKEVGLQPIDAGAALMLALGTLCGSQQTMVTPAAAFEKTVVASRPLFTAGFRLARTALAQGKKPFDAN